MLSVNVPSTPDLDTVSDTGPSATDDNTNVNTPAFSGTADANSLIHVGTWVDGNADNLVDDGEVSNIAEVTANNSGDYSATLSTLADGSYQIVAKAFDEFGNPSVGSNNGWSNPLNIVIDTTIAATILDLAPASDSVSPNTVLPGTDTDNLTNINTPVFQGTAEPGAAIELFDGANPTPIATTVADATGEWVTSALAAPLTDDVHSITAKVTDVFGNTSTSDPLSVTIDTIVSTNTSPGMTAATDSGSSSSDGITNDNTPTFTGMTEDGDPNNAYVELLLDGTTVIGTGNASNGAWTMTPLAPISDGTHMLAARVTDRTGNVSTSGSTVVVIDTASPNAIDDNGSSNEDTPVTINVVGNDSDSIDLSLTVTGVTNGSSGTAINNGDGTVTYTPNLNFNGPDTFTYTVTDDAGNSTIATVNVTVNSVNDPPVAVDDTATTNEDTPITTDNVLSNDTDVDNTLTPASITAFTQGANGTVSNNGDGTFTYTPSTNFHGTDSFTYTISDGASSDTATVNVTVNSVNDPPVAGDDVATTNEDTPATLNVLANDNGGPANEVQTVTVTATTNGANGTVTTDGTSVTYTPNLNFHGSDTFTYTITDDGGLTDTATVNITVNPSVVVTGPSSANDGQSLTFTFTTSAPGSSSPYTRTIVSSNPLDVVTPMSFDTNTGSGTFKVTLHGPIGTSMSILTVNVNETGGALVGTNTRSVTVNNTFRVTGIVVNDSGFDFTFNAPIDFTNLNLYDGINPLLPGDTLRLPDVVVHAAIGNFDMKGSVVWTAATNTLSWVKSGNVLGADTYFIKLVSGADAFKDTSGNLLDGNSDFVAGGNYQQSVPISILGGTPIVSLPDFARAPGQGVDLTASNTLDTTLPVRATGVNVQGVDFKLVYNTTLLSINPDQITAALPNWSVAANQSVVGTVATLIVSASANLPSAAFTGTTAFVNISATVPTTAPYGATQVLRLIDCEVNEVNSQDDIAIQKVAFPGDANGSGVVPLWLPPNAYTAEDAALIARVIVGAMGTTGFDAHPLVDPAIVGDASGNGGASLSAFDTSLIAQESAGINTPEVPDGTAAGTGGSAQYDPQLSIPDNVPVLVGHTYELPVNITIEPTVPGIYSSTYIVRYLTSDLDFLGASNGSDFLAPGWSMTVSEPVPGTIRVAIYNSTSASGNNGGVPLQLGKLNFAVQSAANLGVSPLQIDPVALNENGLLWTKDDGSVLISHLEGDYNLDNSVDAADYLVWRKASSMSGTGGANESGYITWKSNFGATFPGSGTGAVVSDASLNESVQVPISSSSEVTPTAAREEVWARFAVNSRSADLRTLQIARNSLLEEPQGNDQNLLFAVTNEKRNTAVEYDSVRNANNADYSDAVDELLSDLDCELTRML